MRLGTPFKRLWIDVCCGAIFGSYCIQFNSWSKTHDVGWMNSVMAKFLPRHWVPRPYSRARLCLILTGGFTRILFRRAIDAGCASSIGLLRGHRLSLAFVDPQRLLAFGRLRFSGCWG